jgi:RNA polymerase sigma-70 factor (ECF subfamily)
MPDPDTPQHFLGLLEAHRRILYKVARVYGRTDADREDLVQETVAQLWRAFPRYDARWRFSTWMYRVALNVAVSYRRREGTRGRVLVDADDAVLLEVAGAEGPQDREDVAQLYAAIGRLDDLSKALALLYLDGHSQAEMAEVLGISAGNVGTRLWRLKERLKQELGGADDNGKPKGDGR